MLAKLNAIDRRVIYLLLFFSTAVALVVVARYKVKLPVIPSNQTKGAFEAIEKAPTDKVALIGGEWSASTVGENGAQTRALFHHLMRRKIKFGILGFDPQGPENVNNIAKELGPEYGYVYGRDWVNFGFRPVGAINATLKSLVRNIPSALTQDAFGTKLTDTTKLPIMTQMRDINDVGLIVEITPSDTYERWVAFVQGVKRTPMVFSPTAVMAPEAYQYLDSGQMAGMLTGLKGALEYEGLVGKPGKATNQALALSVTHFLIISLIVIGNLGYLSEKRRKAAERGA
jgi:hypothetical protein